MLTNVSSFTVSQKWRTLLVHITYRCLPSESIIADTIASPNFLKNLQKKKISVGKDPVMVGHLVGMEREKTL